MAKRRRLLRQATDETLLRYGAEERGLSRLLRESRANLKLGIRAERATSAGVQAAAKAARPLIRRSYANAGRTFQQAEQDIQTLSGPSSDAAARESAGAKRRMAESLADAETELANRSVDAKAGEAYGIRQRRRDYAGERAKITQEQQDLHREEGLYASSTFRQLSAAEAQRALEARRIRVSIGNLRARRHHDRVTEGQAQQRLGEQHRHNKQTEKNSGGGPGGKPRFTPLQQRGARADWDTAKTRAEAYKKAGKLTMDTWEDVALHISDKFSVDLPLARGAVQLVLRGGVLPRMRRKVHHDYGLSPRVKTRRQALVGDLIGG